ncbi:hypothetical protein HZA39_01450 [Candidatus Peregrinibacteria bacterium]|nr:hypothetical protein [Candidatus Peregrinibacteria bacterium]
MKTPDNMSENTEDEIKSIERYISLKDINMYTAVATEFHDILDEYEQEEKTIPLEEELKEKFKNAIKNVYKWMANFQNKEGKPYSEKVLKVAINKAVKEWLKGQKSLLQSENPTIDEVKSYIYPGNPNEDPLTAEEEKHIQKVYTRARAVILSIQPEDIFLEIEDESK